MNLVSEFKNHRLTLLLHSFIWAFLICCRMIQIIPNQYLINVDFYVEWVSFITLFYLNYLYLVPKFLYPKKYLLYSVMILTVVIVIIVIRLEFFITDLHNLVSSKMLDFDGSEITIPQVYYQNTSLFLKIRLLLPYLIIIFISLIIRTLTEYYSIQNNKLIVESQRKTIELTYLRKQINPHFLFNSLNAIYSLANKKSDLVADAIVTLSELMRYMLYETDSKSVLLEKEINYIKNYIELQKLRLNDIENIRINIQGNTENKYIEPLLLISFIENAFKFGTDYKGATYVKIKITVNGNTLDFWVENKVEKRSPSSEGSGIGISNIESRLQLLYPNSHTLIISEENNMYSVFLKLQLDQIVL